jgi:hypothetical protein
VNVYRVPPGVLPSMRDVDAEEREPFIREELRAEREARSRAASAPPPWTPGPRSKYLDLVASLKDLLASSESSLLAPGKPVFG